MAGRVLWVLKFGVAGVVALVLLEVFIRFTGTSSPSMVVDDDNLGKVLRPGLDVVFVNEGFQLGRINRYGYLGRGYPPEKPEGVVRIALMGDSYVAGIHVFDRHHFRSIMERQLNQTALARVEVLNLGFPAINFEQMYLYHRLLAERFSPDFVIYVVGTSSLNKPADEVGPRVIVEDDSLRIDFSFRTSRAYALSRRLSPVKELGLYGLLRKALAVYAAGNTPDVLFDKFYRLLKPGRGGQEAEETAPVEDAKRLPLNHAIVRRLGAADSTGTARSVIVARGRLPDTFIEAVVRSGVTFMDPTARLDSLEEAGIDPHYWKGSQRRGHWNHYAHRVIGDFLATEMLPLVNARAEAIGAEKR